MEHSFHGEPPTTNAIVRAMAFNSLSNGGSSAAGASAVAWGPDRLDVFAVSDRGALEHWWTQDGLAWPERSELHTATAPLANAAPGAASWGAGRLDAFCVGTDHQLHHFWWDHGAFGGVEALGGNLPATNAKAIAWGPNRLDAFAIGADGALQHWWLDGARFQGPESLGGTYNASTAPSVVSWGAGRLDVFAVDRDRTLGHHWFENGWKHESLGGIYPAIEPGVRATTTNSIDVVVIPFGQRLDAPFDPDGGILTYVEWRGQRWETSASLVSKAMPAGRVAIGLGAPDPAAFAANAAGEMIWFISKQQVETLFHTHRLSNPAVGVIRDRSGNAKAQVLLAASGNDLVYATLDPSTMRWTPDVTRGTSVAAPTDARTSFTFSITGSIRQYLRVSATDSYVSVLAPNQTTPINYSLTDTGQAWIAACPAGQAGRWQYQVTLVGLDAEGAVQSATSPWWEYVWQVRGPAASITCDVVDGADQWSLVAVNNL